MSRRQSGAKTTISLKQITICFAIISMVLASPQQIQDRHPEQKQDLRERAAIQGTFSRRLPIVNYDNIGRDAQQVTDLDDASAVPTLAPAGNAVAAPKSVQEYELQRDGKSTTSAGLSSTLINARSLQDWEVEDFILLATVDGSIHARDRFSGEERWNLEVDRPLVESIYHRENATGIEAHRPQDDYLWIVEPTKDGNMYILDTSGKMGLQKPPTTIKKLAEEFSPFYAEESAVIYTTEKKTTLFAVDAATGVVTKTFSSGGSSKNEAPRCRRINRLEGSEDDKCGSNGSIMLGRTEYTVNIDHLIGGPICTLKYFEWGPNSRDSDLQAQYQATPGRNYVYSRYDGKVSSFDVDNTNHEKPNPTRRYDAEFSSPVVRVFDVARPAGYQHQDTQLVLLQQPSTPQLKSFDSLANNEIFINKTKAGGWFAMSEVSYPHSTQGARRAAFYRDSLGEYRPRVQREQSLIGLHSLSTARGEGVGQLLTISGPLVDDQTPPIQGPIGSPREIGPAPSGSTLFSPFKGRHQSNNDAFGIFVITCGILFVTLLFFDSIRVRKLVKQLPNVFGSTVPKLETVASSPIAQVFPDEDEPTVTVPISPTESAATTNSGPVDETSDASGSEATPKLRKVTLLEPPRSRAATIGEVRGRTKDAPHVRIVEPSPSPAPTNPDDDAATDSTITSKKKGRRGCRGGNRRGKKKGKLNDTKDVEETVEEVLQIAKTPTKLQPDVLELKTTSPMDVSGPIIQIGSLRVFTDTTLGFGSHGTVVYKGSFDGRDVAVKRMLLEFYDIATHEVEILKDSDDHRNVIRYYNRESHGQFLYIALELCPASLQDLIERPQDFSDLIGPQGIDPPDILRQITEGLKYLHSLKIVHRDLKPQNILVSRPKKLAIPVEKPEPPRILISDFGLCKKLEGDQSSFRATTAQAAGTTGWRAPELLVDDDPMSTSTNGMSSSSLPPSTTSDSEPLIVDSQTNRRATRAIDIFSLGCVFYFVLTGGSHPFDRDGRYMREANVIKSHYSLEELAKLGDYQWEARDLIGSMIHHNPKARPDAANILRHPFFWNGQVRLDFLCTVSDMFEFESRDPPSPALQALEALGPAVLKDCNNDFLRVLPSSFKDTLGKQRKYVGSRMLDLLRAMRNKKSHYEDMPDNVQKMVGPLPEGYLTFWTRRFPGLLMGCHKLVYDLGWNEKPRFAVYYTG